MNDTAPLPPDHSKQTVAIIVIIGILAGAGFLGYRKFMDWHEKTVESALTNQKQALTEKVTDQAIEVQRLKDALAKQEPPEASSERLTEVFGTPEAGAPDKAADSCDAIEKRITNFFSYIKTIAPDAGADESQNFPAGTIRILDKLSSRLPMITDETRDVINLKHNEAHFFRVLGKESIRSILMILNVESDVLEPVLADFYQYYLEKDCCITDAGESCVTLDTLYTYAGFFLETLAGKSYLFRRTARMHCLAEYYAVRILDAAVDAGINPYGIDIRPHIVRSLDRIQSQNQLVFQDTYESVLLGLMTKYIPSESGLN